MRANKVGALVILAVLLALVCLASPLAGANPPAEQGVRVAASVAPLLQYQWRLLDPPTGEPVEDGVYVMAFRIYSVETDGTALWTESKDVPVENGLFSTVLGDVTPLDQALFNGQALWLGVKVDADAEAVPLQPILPVAYALGLVPGAVINGDDITSGTVAETRIDAVIARDAEVSSVVSGHAGDPDAHHSRYTDSEAWSAVLGSAGPGSTLDADLLDGQDSSTFAGASHEHNELYYTEGEADGRFLNSTGPDAISGSSADPILEVNQSGTGYGVWSEADGPSPAVFGRNNGTGYGVYGYGNSSYGGRFYSVSGTALQAQGDAVVTGNLAVGGAVTYSSPRTHQLMLASENFMPRSDADYYTFGGNGGAYRNIGISGHLVAPLHLPDGAVVTGFKAFFFDESSSDLTITLWRQGMTSAYVSMAEVISSGSAGYGNLTDTTISYATIDYANYSYCVTAFSSSWDLFDLTIKGALITYTIDEAP